MNVSVNVSDTWREESEREHVREKRDVHHCFRDFFIFDGFYMNKTDLAFGIKR